ncbi:hypothetical protein [Pararobbsia alpina]|uniref:hypothetical protein n=1 Tax=Pararobbsia alpina TaxID=621374 RepID=UPI0039A723E9
MRRATPYRTPEHNALLREADRQRQQLNNLRAFVACAVIVVALVFDAVHVLVNGG